MQARPASRASASGCWAVEIILDQPPGMRARTLMEGRKLIEDGAEQSHCRGEYPSLLRRRFRGLRGAAAHSRSRPLVPGDAGIGEALRGNFPAGIGSGRVPGSRVEKEASVSPRTLRPRRTAERLIYGQHRRMQQRQRRRGTPSFHAGYRGYDTHLAFGFRGDAERAESAHDRLKEKREVGGGRV